MIQKLLDEYMAMFNENFPTFIVEEMEEKEIIKILEKCIKDKKPYTDYEKDINY